MIKKLVKNRMFLLGLSLVFVSVILLAAFVQVNYIQAYASDVVPAAGIGQWDNPPRDFTVVWMVIGILGGGIVFGNLTLFLTKMIREKREDRQAERDYMDKKIEEQSSKKVNIKHSHTQEKIDESKNS